MEMFYNGRVFYAEDSQGKYILNLSKRFQQSALAQG